MTYEPVSLESLLSHQTWAMRLARRLVHEEGEAEDLLQRTWIAALRHPPGSERGARAWIRKVILNLARERYRRDQTRRRHELAGSSEERHAPDAYELTSHKEICGLLGQQLLALDEPYRTVLVQRFYDGLSSAEISRRLGVPSGTVRWRLKIGLDQLREELDRRSHGDRSKWVSSLLLFAGPGSVADFADEPRAEVAPTGAGWLPTTAWVGFSVALVAGGYFALRDPGSRSGDASLAALAPGLSPPEQPTSTPVRPSERLPLLGNAPEPAPAAGSVAGLRVRVVDESGSPVAGARLFVGTARGYLARGESDARGQATLVVEDEDVGALGLLAWRERVGVRALAEGRAASELVHVAPPFTSENEVTLVVGGPEHVLRGRVLDTRGQPVAEAEVAWIDAARRADTLPGEDAGGPWYLSTRSAEDGRFELRNLPPDPGNALVFATGFAIGTSDLGALDPTAGLTPVFTLERGGSVSGRVRAPGGRAAAGVIVRAEPSFRGGEWATGLRAYDPTQRGFAESTRTDEDGAFRLEHLTSGPRRLWAIDEERGLVDSIALTVVDGGSAHWEAELAQRAVLDMQLVDQTGRPLPDWIAHLRRPDGGGTWWIRRQAADAEGRVSIADCPAEEAYLDVFPPTDSGASYLSQRIQPQTGIQVVRVDTSSKSTVAGRLLDSEGLPVLDGRLAFFSLRTSLTSAVERGADGSFELELAPGRYVLLMRRGPAALDLARVSAEPGVRRELGTLSLPPMGTLRLDGAALHNGNARTPSFALYAPLGGTREGRFLRAHDGTFEDEVLLSLFAGRYRLHALDASGAPEQLRWVEVAPFAETRLELRP